LFYHAWVGMREILMDYANPAGLRLSLHGAVIVWLVGCAGWAAQIIWRA
ncbi:MAG TPA: succinate dehydrogenase, hydrophobic membrane anchor protein, partial [Oxalobacteraceae bacterium]|nr:succinate dehydrogenase, hydrophobic membrane anchor protein [Oxalobacteraceae bacterium]